MSVDRRFKDTVEEKGKADGMGDDARAPAHGRNGKMGGRGGGRCGNGLGRGASAERDGGAHTQVDAWGRAQWGRAGEYTGEKCRG
jgi:hypothetical protein